jgi:DNA repair photolyase
MFPDVSETWNPITGCRFGCVYCWARRLAETVRRAGRLEVGRYAYVLARSNRYLLRFRKGGGRRG